MCRAFEGQAETLRFDEVGHRELRTIIKERSDMKLVLEDNQSDRYSRRAGVEKRVSQHNVYLDCLAWIRSSVKVQ